MISEFLADSIVLVKVKFYCLIVHVMTIILSLRIIARLSRSTIVYFARHLVIYLSIISSMSCMYARI